MNQSHEPQSHEPQSHEPEKKAYWLCEECGFKDKVKPLPSDREVFYKLAANKPNGTASKCRLCKSIALMPKGF